MKMRERLLRCLDDVRTDNRNGHVENGQEVVDAILTELAKPFDPEEDVMVLVAGHAALPEHDEPLQEDAQACFTAMIARI